MLCEYVKHDCCQKGMLCLCVCVGGGGGGGGVAHIEKNLKTEKLTYHVICQYFFKIRMHIITLLIYGYCSVFMGLTNQNQFA